LQFFADIHASLQPEWYFEIGANTGLGSRLIDL
jgi:hypothetical protein